MSTNEVLTAQQQEILFQFRDQVSDVLKPDHDDHYLLRWLRARCFDVKKAEDMLRKSVKWRKKWRADTILDEWEPPEVLVKYYPGGHTGYDKEGAPIWVFPSGALDMKGLTLAAKKADILKYNIVYLQLLHKDCEQQTEKLGRTIDKGILIEDLEGFTMKKLLMPGMEVLLTAMAMVEANYPESLKQCYVVNAPSIFPLIYKVVKPFLSEDTKKKITILGKNWREDLLKVIDADQLPQHWGGTQAGADGNPHCEPKVCLAGEVPHCYYLMGHQAVDPEKVKIATVSRRDALRLSIEVKEVGQVIKWVFWTEDYDIGFAVLSKNGLKSNGAEATKGQVSAVVPMSRVNCHLVPEDGCYHCEHTGTYEVLFDNSYSWIHSKRLSYSLEVVHPETDTPHNEEEVHIMEDDELDLK